jgi:peptidoglycan/LPS O-acetylase OafA/YrhL
VLAVSRSVIGFREFQSSRYFPALDGLRAVSIFLVVALHSGDALFIRWHGTVGVTVFFVISGWLITTLLLREEDRLGRVRLGAFYVRRAFRLLPVYFAVLALVLVALAVAPGEGNGLAPMLRALPYYVTYQNEFAPSAAFGHTWSLAVEEKFYVVWPLLAFTAVVLRRARLCTVVGLLALALAAEAWGSTHYLATYTPLLLGCLLALLMHRERGYRMIGHLRHPLIVAALLMAAAYWTANFEGVHGHVHTVFAIITVLALPGIIGGAGWIRAAFGNRVFAYVGTRSYALYLVHPLVIVTVSAVVPADAADAGHQVGHFALAFACSLTAAEMLFRVVERPLIRVGSRYAAILTGGPGTRRSSPLPEREGAHAGSRSLIAGAVAGQRGTRA